ncbi:MAG: bifunctional lysylphosphatidylglycerol flippase/synthetase MprF [Elusimicrobiales bacterium]|nr:bifunctional lysylphosphatidylglycerol flippase/synthetase MprF [Elusimicrobiales bacterium]
MKKIARYAVPFFGVALFAAAMLALHHELQHYSYHQIAAEFRSLPYWRILLAVLLTGLNYTILTCYDLLAFRYLGRAQPYSKIAPASFTAFAFSNNIGMAALSGGSIRLRLYSAQGLSSLDIARIIGFGIATFWLGVLSLGGAVFLLHPPALPAGFSLPFSSLRALGLFMLSAAGLYLGLAVRAKPFSLRGFELNLPRPGLALMQLAVSAVDWAVAAGVLFVLLPSSGSFGYFDLLAVFMLAQVAGLASQVPGGLGVFETIIIVFAGRQTDPAQVMGALLAYRVVYYLLPLLAASAYLALHELPRRAGALLRLAPGLVPQALSIVVFTGGAVLLFSGATPGVHSRLLLLGAFLPLPLLEASHFLASVGGAALLVIARGLQRRLDAAYHAATLLLGAGIVLSVLKGLDVEEALLLSAMLAALYVSRSEFYRKASLLAESFSPGWIAAVLLAVGASVWLGLFSFKHVEYSNSLWWQFEAAHNAPRFLRGSAGATLAVLLFALSRLFRAARPEITSPSAPDLELAAKIAAASGDTSAWLALLGDKEIIFSEKKGAFLMYSVRGRSWVCLGGPVGPEAERRELLWRFAELCDEHGGRPVFYEVPAADLASFADLGMTFLNLGEEGKVPLAGFSLEGGARKALRQTVTKVEKEGFVFEVVPREQVPALLPELRRISDSWLAEKKTREKGFSLGYFSEDYIRYFPCALVKKDGALFAFANIWTGAGEVSVDLMRYVPGSPNGVMDYLFTKLMLWGKEGGYAAFDLGMAPLSGIQVHALSPLGSRLGSFLYRHGENFYNFQGLRSYKEKFDPLWSPRYLASPGGLALPGIIMDVTALVSGGIKGAVSR